MYLEIRQSDPFISSTNELPGNRQCRQDEHEENSFETKDRPMGLVGAQSLGHIIVENRPRFVYPPGVY